MAAQVREICERYGMPYNSGPLPKQFATVVRKIVRLALPDAYPQSAASRPPWQPRRRIGYGCTRIRIGLPSACSSIRMPS